MSPPSDLSVRQASKKQYIPNYLCQTAYRHGCFRVNWWNECTIYIHGLGDSRGNFCLEDFILSNLSHVMMI
jgi:hypothetical protein